MQPEQSPSASLTFRASPSHARRSQVAASPGCASRRSPLTFICADNKIKITSLHGLNATPREFSPTEAFQVKCSPQQLRKLPGSHDVTIELTHQAEPAQAEALFLALAEWLPTCAGRAPAELHEGLHEWRDGRDCWVSLVRSSPSLFAMRWDHFCGALAGGQESAPAGGVAAASVAERIRCEAFFVPSAAHGALAGLTVYRPAALPDGASAWGQDIVSKWQRLPGLGEQLALRPPSFMQIVAQTRGSLSPASAVAVQEDLSRLRCELQQAQALAQDLSQSCGQLKAELRAKRASRRTEEGAAAAEAGQAPARSTRDLTDLPQWAQANAEHIEVLPRALGGAKKSIFEDPAQVFAGLEFLAGPYRRYRSGELSKPEMEAALASSGLRLAGSVGRSVAGSQGDAYFTTWRGRRRMFDLHLLKGSGRDERYCLRIYFFWSAEDHKAVVGWLPSHLSNSLS